jgi:hypothetical protein
MALRIAETGHLTFATLHTNSAASTINRIIDVFPSAQQSQVRTQLSLVLEGILVSSAAAESVGRRSRDGARNSDSERRYPQSDPRRQNSPDLFDDADRTGQIRNADVQSGARHALSKTFDFARNRDAALVERRRTERFDRTRFRAQPILRRTSQTGRAERQRRWKSICARSSNRTTPAVR